MAADFMGMPIVFDQNMPVGCMVIMTEDGRKAIPIVNIDIEVCGPPVTERPKIIYGEQRITGTMTANFENPQLLAQFTSGVSKVGRYAMEAIVTLGDQYARTGRLNRSGRKQWRKDRRRIMRSIRREDARGLREAFGRPVF